MVQQNELLGPEPLSLDGAFKSAEDAQPDELKPAVPTMAAAAAAVPVISPMVVDAPAAAAAPAVAAAEQEPDQAPHARAAPRSRRGRAPAARGRKRKQAADEDFEPEDDVGAEEGGPLEAAEVCHGRLTSPAVDECLLASAAKWTAAGDACLA